MSAPAEIHVPAVEDHDFALVEEDDVVFALSLCREIHRIYGTYHSGELHPSDSVRLGLSLTAEMLATLANTVTNGMPAMRLEVAAAQTREMMAVLLGQPIPPGRGRGLRQQRERTCLRSALAQSRSAMAIGAASAKPDSPGTPGAAKRTMAVPPPESSAADPTAMAPAPAADSLSERWLGWVRARSLVVRILIGVVGCASVAVLIDVPVAILLLFSDLFVPLLVSFVVLGVAARWTYHSRVVNHRRRCLGEDAQSSLLAIIGGWA